MGQPALALASIASFRSAESRGVIDSEAVTAYAGLSLGEYTALHLGGAFGFEEGLKRTVEWYRTIPAAAKA